MRKIYMNTSEFLIRFQGIMTEIWKLVKRKNEQYATNDALANFSTGARILNPDDSAEWQYQALRSYMLKHVAHVFNNRLMGNGVRESLGDIATYCIIGMVMHDAIDTRLQDSKEVAYRIEQRIIGAILIDGRASEIAMKNLALEDFSAPQHQTILRAMIDIYPDELDLVAVAEKLRKWDALSQVGGVAYLTFLGNCVPDGKNIYHDIADLMDLKRNINENFGKGDTLK